MDGADAGWQMGEAGAVRREEGADGRGLHSFRFQLNMSSFVHRVTQLNS